MQFYASLSADEFRKLQENQVFSGLVYDSIKTCVMTGIRASARILGTSLSDAPPPAPTPAKRARFSRFVIAEKIATIITENSYRLVCITVDSNVLAQRVLNQNWRCNNSLAGTSIYVSDVHVNLPEWHARRLDCKLQVTAPAWKLVSLGEQADELTPMTARVDLFSAVSRQIWETMESIKLEGFTPEAFQGFNFKMNTVGQMNNELYYIPLFTDLHIAALMMEVHLRKMAENKLATTMDLIYLKFRLPSNFVFGQAEVVRFPPAPHFAVFDIISILDPNIGVWMCDSGEMSVHVMYENSLIESIPLTDDEQLRHSI